jgi:di/tripeptidase
MPRGFKQDSLDTFVKYQSQIISDSSLKTEISYPAKSPAWAPQNSWLIEVLNNSAQISGYKPFRVWSSTGGLETAEFYSQRPEVPMVAIGPTIKGAHNETERVKISTVDSTIQILDKAMVEIGEHPEFHL